MNNEFTLIGAGGHAKVIIELIEESGGSVKEVMDSNPALTQLMGYSVIQEQKPSYTIIVSVGNNKTRQRITEKCEGLFGRAIHPHANISKRSSIGDGSVVMAGTSINAETVIGKHCIINTNASVDHECKISDFVHIAPNASLGGNVTVGEGSWIGIGSCIIQGITIGQWATIGAGTVIVEDVPDYAVVVGVPGKIIKYNKP
jgi:sugar O-acyltransferase (sialic acid O-acetyltransferase NeuD family)